MGGYHPGTSPVCWSGEVRMHPAGESLSEGRNGSCRAGDCPASEGYLSWCPVPSAGDLPVRAQGASHDRALHPDRGLANGKCYHEAGADFFAFKGPDRSRRSAITRLQQLGSNVELTAREAA